MIDQIYELPIQSLAVLTAIVFVGFYWLGCVFLRPVIRMIVSWKGADNEIVGNVLSAHNMLYGLLLSLIAMAAYQNLIEVDAVVGDEASALLALYRDASDFPPPQRERLCSLLRDYCQFTIDQEWPLQRKGVIPLGAHQRWLKPIGDIVFDFQPESKRDELLQAAALKHFDALEEHGRQRRHAAEAAIPTVMWYVVIVGTIISSVLMWLFQMRFVTQLFLGGLLAFFLGTLILLIAVLERPYRSIQFGVSPEAHQLVYDTMIRDEILQSDRQE